MNSADNGGGNFTAKDSKLRNTQNSSFDQDSGQGSASPDADDQARQKDRIGQEDKTRLKNPNGKKDIVSLSDVDFKAELTQVVPHLRAYGRSLTGNLESADDIVQDTLLKAWGARTRFAAGTNMRAWTFIILRNVFLSQIRRAKFTGEWDDIIADRVLSTEGDQDSQLYLADVQRALMLLPQNQREALILVGAGGFSYEEAADICDCALGTIKSRVARGRTALERLLEDDMRSKLAQAGKRGSQPLKEIMAELDKLSGETDSPDPND